MKKIISISTFFIAAFALNINPYVCGERNSILGSDELTRKILLEKVSECGYMLNYAEPTDQIYVCKKIFQEDKSRLEAEISRLSAECCEVNYFIFNINSISDVFGYYTRDAVYLVRIDFEFDDDGVRRRAFNGQVLNSCGLGYPSIDKDPYFWG